MTHRPRPPTQNRLQVRAGHQRPGADHEPGEDHANRDPRLEPAKVAFLLLAHLAFLIKGCTEPSSDDRKSCYASPAPHRPPPFPDGTGAGRGRAARPGGSLAAAARSSRNSVSGGPGPRPRAPAWGRRRTAPAVRPPPSPRPPPRSTPRAPPGSPGSVSEIRVGGGLGEPCTATTGRAPRTARACRGTARRRGRPGPCRAAARRTTGTGAVVLGPGRARAARRRSGCGGLLGVVAAVRRRHRVHPLRVHVDVVEQRPRGRRSRCAPGRRSGRKRSSPHQTSSRRQSTASRAAVRGDARRAARCRRRRRSARSSAEPRAAWASTRRVISRAATALASTSGRGGPGRRDAHDSADPRGPLGLSASRVPSRGRGTRVAVLGEPDGLVVHVVGVEPAQLLGEQLGRRAAGQRDLPVGLAGPGQRRHAGRRRGCTAMSPRPRGQPDRGDAGPVGVRTGPTGRRAAPTATRRAARALGLSGSRLDHRRR